MSDWLDDIDGEVEKPDDGEERGLEEIAPDAMTLEEAKETDPVWRILIWSDPGLGKTHFAYTMPEPVCFIDTEGKADTIAHKFDKQVHLWQPTDYDEARDALDQAVDVLQYTRGELGGPRGTIVVDSMSVIWGWSQQKYVDEYYFDKDITEAREEFSTGFGSGKSDWKKIKDFHNDKFRKKMLDTDFHLCWTARREDDYETMMEQDVRNADKPAGEKQNPYKATDIIRITEDAEGKPVGILQKSGLVKSRYAGLKYPTFPKHKEVTRSIEEQEIDGVSTDEIETGYEVTVAEGRPKFQDND